MTWRDFRSRCRSDPARPSLWRSRARSRPAGQAKIVASGEVDHLSAVYMNSWTLWTVDLSEPAVLALDLQTVQLALKRLSHILAQTWIITGWQYLCVLGGEHCVGIIEEVMTGGQPESDVARSLREARDRWPSDPYSAHNQERGPRRPASSPAGSAVGKSQPRLTS